MTRRHRKNLPSVWLMTDERMPWQMTENIARELPRGHAGIIFRYYATPRAERRAMFRQLAVIARRRRLLIFVGGPEKLALVWKADGWHGPTRGTGKRLLLHSMAVHGKTEVIRAQRQQADLLFLSPLFATRSHPGAAALGPARFAALACPTPIPVMALGGVKARHSHMLKALGASGWGAIDGLMVG